MTMAISPVLFGGKHVAVTGYDPVYLVHDELSASPLRIRIFAARVQPYGFVQHVVFVFKQIAHDPNGPQYGRPYDDGHVAQRMAGGRDDSDVVVDFVYTVAVERPAVGVVRVSVAHAPADHMLGVQKQIVVAHVIRVTVGADHVVDVIAPQAVLLDSGHQTMAVPRGHGVDDDVFRPFDQRARAIGQRTTVFGRPAIAYE